MTSHPNRSARGSPSAAPAPEVVRQFRRSLELSASQAARLVHVSPRSWLQWESGDRRMHPAFWELARLKASRACPAL